MNNRFLASVAVLALVAGTSLAYAESGGMNHEQSGASMQNNSPSTGGSSAEQGGARHHRLSPKSVQSEQKNSTVGRESSSEGKASDHKKGMSSQHEATGNEDMKSHGREGRSASSGTESSKQAEQRKSKTTGENQGQAASTSGRNGMQKSPSSGQSESQSQERSQTSGQAGGAGRAGASAKLSSDQRTQITSVIKEEHVAPTKNVNFSISVGARVPREHVSLHTLPSKVVTIYPEWRGYKFILVHDEIVVVNPRTYEIVAVLPA